MVGHEDGLAVDEQEMDAKLIEEYAVPVPVLDEAVPVLVEDDAVHAKVVEDKLELPVPETELLDPGAYTNIVIVPVPPHILVISPAHALLQPEFVVPKEDQPGGRGEGLAVEEGVVDVIVDDPERVPNGPETVDTKVHKPYYNPSSPTVDRVAATTLAPVPDTRAAEAFAETQPNADQPAGREEVVAEVVEVPETMEEAEDVEDNELEHELDDDDDDEDDPVAEVYLNNVIVHVPLHTLGESPAHALLHDELLAVVPEALSVFPQ
ncbi:hypothetical protein FRC04_001205 [Tulasnella sp. 424]|nr:hypothetical protein FRC04_001205 [Tulasnella sp. 424]